MISCNEFAVYSLNLFKINSRKKLLMADILYRESYDLKHLIIFTPELRKNVLTVELGNSPAKLSSGKPIKGNCSQQSANKEFKPKIVSISSSSRIEHAE